MDRPNRPIKSDFTSFNIYKRGKVLATDIPTSKMDNVEFAKSIGMTKFVRFDKPTVADYVNAGMVLEKIEDHDAFTTAMREYNRQMELFNDSIKRNIIEDEGYDVTPLTSAIYDHILMDDGNVVSGAIDDMVSFLEKIEKAIGIKIIAGNI